MFVGIQITFTKTVSRLIRTVHCGAICLLVGGPAFSDDVSKQQPGDVEGTGNLARLCESFASIELPHEAKITATEFRAATESLLEVCIVRGQIVSSPESTINWAVELVDPTVWNSKAVTIGGGGFDGFIPTDQEWTQNWYGDKPYVRMSSDSGHQVRSFYPWAMDDVALRNHGYLANHQILEVGTRIAQEFYGRAPRKRYMLGISNGGRAGLVSAERYPDDYDGVVALAPAISQQAHEVNTPKITRHVFASRDNWMSKADIELFMEAEIAACDQLDGLKDGIIGNYMACDYGGSDLVCEEEKTDACLTDGQLESVRLIHSDKPGRFQLADKLPAGYPRFGPGGAPSGDWVDYIFGEEFDEPGSFNFYAADQAAKVVERNPDASAFTHDATKYEEEWQRLSRALDPTRGDLSQFAANGGKLLIWYPTGDTCVTIHRTAQYYERLKDSMGEAEVKAFSRFYALPALGHVFQGPAANSVDFLDKLDAWIETGKAPDGHVAVKYQEGGEVAFERPVCEFPHFPRYDGEGDPSSAGSFYCSAE